MGRTTRSSSVLLSCLAAATTTAIAVEPPHTKLAPMLANAGSITLDTEWVPVLLDTTHLATLRVQGANGSPLSDPTIDTSFSITSATLGASDVTPAAANVDLYSFVTRTNNNDDVRFRMDRNTALSDGGIVNQNQQLGDNDQRVASVVQGEGEYSLMDLEMMWNAMSSGDFEFNIVSGITAIEADVSKPVSSGGVSDVADVHSRAVVVPTIGSAVSWSITDDWSISGQALTQSIDLGSSFVDFTAKADWRVTDSIGLSAGYQIIRSSFDVGPVTSDLTQEGLFARLQIRF